jgi:hypothetical protein
MRRDDTVSNHFIAVVQYAREEKRSRQSFLDIKRESIALAVVFNSLQLIEPIPVIA